LEGGEIEGEAFQSHDDLGRYPHNPKQLHRRPGHRGTAEAREISALSSALPRTDASEPASGAERLKVAPTLREESSEDEIKTEYSI